MRRTRCSLAAWCAAALIGAAATAVHGAAIEASGDAARFPAIPIADSGTREFHWTIRVPLLTVEQREFVFRAPTGISRPQRWDYEGPAVRTERRKIAVYPEFSCKYVDWTVSNACRTVWRGIYADLPIVVTRPQHLVFDVPDWRWKTQQWPIAVPRLTWKEERWTVSVPVIVTEPIDDARAAGANPARVEVESARSTLTRKEVSALAVIDDGLRVLDLSIGAVQARGADPGRIETDDGSTLDLIAARTAMRAERADAARSFQRIGEELAVAAKSPRASGE